jgi:hypothetical protein
LAKKKNTEDDILAMLSKGIAYAACGGTEPVVKGLYQQVSVVHFKHE